HLRSTSTRINLIMNGRQRNWILVFQIWKARDNVTYWSDCTEIEGLTFLGNIEVSYVPYEFDLIGVWKGEDGYYVGTDSGCSCPTPWEYIGSVDSLTGPMTREHMRLAV